MGLTMEIAERLKGVTCSCGRHHDCDIGFVAIEHNAIRHLTNLCDEKQSILLVADENTYGAAKQKIERALDKKQITKVIFSGKSVLIPNEEAIERVQIQLPGHDLIIGVGAGVIQDLCKYVSFYSDIPYYIVATAPSMDGYASTGAAMITGGMKVTYSCKVPDAILADTEILKDAPFAMIQAGYGDIIGKYSALNDWKLSHIVNEEYYCQEIYDMTMQAVERTLRLADGLVKRDEESVKTLMEALILVGIAMSHAGSSRPASGSEHHLSHFFEITGLVKDEPYFSHGIDVAYSTMITAELREQIWNNEFPERCCRKNHEEYKAEMKRIYGHVAEACIALQEKAGFYAGDLSPIYRMKEKEIRSVLREMPRAKEIERMLNAVRLDKADFFGLYGEHKIADAIAYAKDLKDRYSVLWLYHDLFGK